MNIIIMALGEHRGIVCHLHVLFPSPAQSPPDNVTDDRWGVLHTFPL